MSPFVNRQPYVMPLLALLLLTAGCHNTAKQDDVTLTGQAMQRDNVMSVGDYRKVVALQNQALAKQPLSTQEVDWLFGLLNKNGSVSQETRALRILQIESVLMLCDPPLLPASRKQEAYNLAIEAIKYQGKPQSIVWHGCTVLRLVGNKQAVPYLKPLLASSNMNIRNNARQAIKSLTTPI